MTPKSPAAEDQLAGLPFVVTDRAARKKQRSQGLTKPPAPGDTCPNCLEGRLDYDGLLHLTCIQCGYSLAGGAGCT